MLARAYNLHAAMQQQTKGAIHFFAFPRCECPKSENYHAWAQKNESHQQLPSLIAGLVYLACATP